MLDDGKKYEVIIATYHDVTLIWIKSFTNEHDLIIATLQKQTKKGKWLMKTVSV